MRRLVTVIAVASLAAAAGPSAAQAPWTVEVRAGSAFPTQDVAGTDLNVGYGLEGTIGYRFMPHLGAYAGWDWMHFSADGREGDPGFDLEETGYVFGLQFEHPLLWPGTGPLVRVRVGGTYDHLELESEEGEITADSGHGLGWVAGSGLVLPLGEHWRLTPGIRYRNLSRDLTLGGTTRAANLAYLTFEMGLSRSF